jgi:hypothetical protein
MGLFDFFKKAFTTKSIENSKPSGVIFNEQQKREIVRLTDEPKNNSSSLSPYEILFLDYINGKSIKSPNIAGYWAHEYNLNCQFVIKKLINNGYLAESDYKFNMTKCKLSDLKNYLKDKGLKVTGKKEELIARIINESPEEDSIAYFNNSLFQCTEKAIDILTNNQHIVYSHWHRNEIRISIMDAENFKKENPSLNHYQLFLEILTKRLHEYEQSKSWELYRNDILGMSIVYGDMKDHAKELELLLEVCYRDLSGLSNSGTVSEKMSFLAPGVIARIVATKKELAINEQAFWELFIDTVSKISLENSLYTAEHCYNLLTKKIRKSGSET